ncbi:MAG: hypothetical protein FJW83_04635 [Actinobacteria bacterium]|nr:hypothetical protein [Actinomycetota bacterium]
MVLFLQRVIDGLTNGALYGSLALALTLVYRASGRVNLAQGELATLGTYVAFVLGAPISATVAWTVTASRVLPGTPWAQWATIPAAMVVSAVIAVALERVVLRRASARSNVAAISLSVGLMLLVNAAVSRWWGRGQRPFPSPFGSDPLDQFIIGSVRIRYATVGTWVTLLVVLGLLSLVLRSRVGLAFRAVASHRPHAALCGIRSGRVLSGAWALAAAIGTLVGCLAASTVLLTPAMMTRLLVFSLVAATIGGLASPGGALFGGVLVGLGQTMVAAYVPGVKTTGAFPLLVVAMGVMLYLRPQGLFGVRRQDPDAPAVAAPVPFPGRPARFTVRRDGALVRSARWTGGIALVGALAVGGLVLPYLEARLLTELVGTAIAAWGLGFLLGDAGRISLGHATFMGVGAYASSVIAYRAGVPALVGVALATLVGFAVGTLLGLPALRIRGQELAMVTLCLAVIFPSLLNRFSSITGGELGPPPMQLPTAPSWLGLPTDRTYAWLHLVVIAVAVAVALMLTNIRRSGIGRAIRAAAENDVAAAAMGVPVTRVRTLTFGIASGLAALGGGLVAVQTQAVTASRFDVSRSLALYALLAVCGTRGLVGPSLAAALFIGVPWFMAETGWTFGARGVLPDAPGGGAFLVWGLGLLVVTVITTDGLVPAARRVVDRVVRVTGDDDR